MWKKFHLLSPVGALAAQGLNVLLLDMDPQGSLSQGFLGSAAVEGLRSNQTLAMLFDERSFFGNRNQIVVPTAFKGISLCPANQFLAPFNAPEPESTGMLQYAIREFIAEQSGFDVVLIDCPPNLYRCSWTSMVAADHVVIPVPPEDFGTQGLRAVHQCVEQVKVLNPTLQTMNHLVTRCDGRLLIHRMYEQKLRGMYADSVMKTVIPEASAFKVALTRRSPVQYHDSKSKAAKLTLCLAREILDGITEDESKRKVV